MSRAFDTVDRGILQDLSEILESFKRRELTSEI